MLSLLTNQRPVSRSRDQSRPIRGQCPQAMARPVRYIFLIFSFYTIFEVFVAADLVPAAAARDKRLWI